MLSLTGSGRRYAAAVLVLFAALLVTGSRGGLLSLLLGLFVAGLLLRHHRVTIRWHRAASLGTAMVALLVIEYLWQAADPDATVSALGRLVGSAPARDPIRLYLAESALHWMAERPLAGYGLFSFRYLLPLQAAPGQEGVLTGFVHNDYLQFGLELGLPGLLALLWTVAATGLLAWRLRGVGARRHGRSASPPAWPRCSLMRWSTSCCTRRHWCWCWACTWGHCSGWRVGRRATIVACARTRCAAGC